MPTVSVTIPEALARAAGCSLDDPSAETVRLLALEIYREDKISLERAAELCQMPAASFAEFSARHNAPLHYGVGDPREDRRMLDWLGL